MTKLFSLLNDIHEISIGLGEYLVKNISQRSIKKKDFILKAGHTCSNIYFIESGLFRCFYHKGASEVCTWFMQNGDVMVAIESFYERKASYEWIQALEDSIVWYISYNQLYHIYRNFPEFNYIGRELTQKYYVLWAKQLYGIRMHSALERYAWLVANYPEMVLRIPTKYLASWLGINEYHFSKIKSTL